MAERKTTKEKGVSKINQVEIAMNLYIENIMTQREIADLVGVNENTLKAWIDKNDWKTLRGAKESGRGKILANLLNRLATLTEQENFSADEVLKITKSIEYFSPNKLSVSGQIETIKQFMSFVYERDHKLAKEIAEKEIATTFIENRVKNALSAK